MKKITLEDGLTIGFGVCCMPAVILTGLFCGACECVGTTIEMTRVLFTKKMDVISEEESE